MRDALHVGVEYRRDGCSTCGTRLWCCRAASPPSRSRCRRRSASLRAVDLKSADRPAPSAASTVPAHVRKSFAVKSSPLISRRYAFTSAESITCRVPPLSTYLEKLVAGQIAARLDDARQTLVAQVDRMLDAALAAELEADRRAVDLRVLVAHRGQAERAVVAARIPRCRRGSAFSREAGRRRRALSRAAGRVSAGRRSVRWRMRGSACAKAISRPYFTSSRTSRQRG